MSTEREILLETEQTLEYASRFTFRLAAHAPDGETPHEWYHHLYAENGTVTMSLARSPAGIVVRFAHLADVHVELQGRRVVAFPLPHVPLETVRHLVLDRVLPMLVGHQGRCVLHAAATVVGGRAIIFAGSTHQGKSTLALSLAQRHGGTALADDVLIVEARQGEWRARCLYAGARLWPDSMAAAAVASEDISAVAHYTTKKKVNIAHRVDSAPVGRFYLLQWHDGAVETFPLTPSIAASELRASLVSMMLGEPEVVAAQMARIGELTRAIPVHCLRLPRDLAQLPNVCAAVLAESA